jgi:TRAP-type C4-dicarboxylate transport system substrate-binding protein
MSIVATRKSTSMLGRLSGKAIDTDFLLELAVAAVDRWDRLTPDEQERFRQLGRAARVKGRANLTRVEQKELRTIWKKLHARGLVAEAGRILARRRYQDQFQGRVPDSPSP